MRDFS